MRAGNVATGDDSAARADDRHYAGEMIGGAADVGTLSTATAVLQGTSKKGRLARLLPFAPDN